MMHASEPGPWLHAEVQRAASSPANAEVFAGVMNLVETIVRSRQSAATSDPSTAVLLRLAKTGPCRVSDLAAGLSLDQSTVSRHLAHLAVQGLITRTADPSDGRAQLAEPTESGLKAVSRAIASRVQILDGVLADWTEQDRLQFAHLLNGFTDGFNRQITAQDLQSVQDKGARQ